MILFAGSTFPLEAQFILYNQVTQYVEVIMKFLSDQYFYCRLCFSESEIVLC